MADSSVVLSLAAIYLTVQILCMIVCPVVSTIFFSGDSYKNDSGHWNVEVTITHKGVKDRDRELGLATRRWRYNVEVRSLDEGDEDSLQLVFRATGFPSSSNSTQSPTASSVQPGFPSSSSSTQSPSSASSVQPGFPSSSSSTQSPTASSVQPGFPSSSSSTQSPSASSVPPGNNATRPSFDLCFGCICVASSRCNKELGCKNGVCGLYQITKAYWEEAWSLVNMGESPINGKINALFEQCATDVFCALETVDKYVKLNEKDCNNDGKVDCHDYALLHHLGKGCKGEPSKEYKEKFENCYSSLAVLDNS